MGRKFYLLFNLTQKCKNYPIIFTIVVALLLTASVFLPQQAGAQSPEKMSYQAVIRNSSDVLVTNTQIGMQISILQGSASRTAVYVETQEPTTNANGLVSLEIGTGTLVSGDFSTIDWANGPYFIKTETDPDRNNRRYCIHHYRHKSIIKRSLCVTCKNC